MGKIVFLSGAGLSAPSGLSTFRDNDGLWDKYDLNVVCNYSNWRKNHKLVHEFYNLRRLELLRVKPNDMHYKIAEISKQYQVINLTQNVDDLLERAGCDEVYHLHGSLLKLHCHDCGDEISLSLDDNLEYDFKPCQKCGSKFIKPSIIFFGEMAPLYETLYDTFKSLDDDDLVVIIGTSGAVINVNYLLRHFKGESVLINLEKCEYINDKAFFHVVYDSCDKATSKLDEIISSWAKKCKSS